MLLDFGVGALSGCIMIEFFTLTVFGLARTTVHQLPRMSTRSLASMVSRL